MCKFCDENYVIETTVGNKKLTLHLKEDSKEILDIRLSSGIGLTKPVQINFCPFCGKRLKMFEGFTENYEVLGPYTTEINWKNKEVWLNLHRDKKKVIIPKSTFEMLAQDFRLLEFR